MSVEYKESKYNFRYVDENGRLAVFNARTGKVAVAEGEKAAIILQLLSNPDIPYSRLMQALIDNGYIVEKECDENELIRQKENSIIQNNKNAVINVLVTEACNFSCSYCYMFEHSSTDTIKIDILDAALKYAEKLCRQNIDSISVNWIGGEPLLAHNEILYFMNELRSKVGSKADIRSRITTNGYILTKKIFCRLYEAGVKEYQITFDGDRESHDKWRTLKNGNPTFDVIYRNINDIIDGCPYPDFKISIRVNFMTDTIDSIKSFIHTYYSSFNNDERINMVIRPVNKALTKRNDWQEFSESLAGSHNSYILKKLLYDELFFEIMKNMDLNRKRKFYYDLHFLKPAAYSCEIQSTKNITITPRGRITLCPATIGQKSFELGYLSPDGDAVMNERVEAYRKNIFDRKELEDCGRCRLVPMCKGGCNKIREDGVENPCVIVEEEVYFHLKEYLKLN